MNYEALLGVIENALLLLALGVLYDSISLKTDKKLRSVNILTGFIIGAIGITLMLNPWEFGQGVFFDTRSILLCITGLFFGFIPAFVATIIIGLFRIYQGGTGIWTGVAVIISSTIMGLIWKKYHPKLDGIPKWLDLYIFGLAVHIIMLLWMLTLPWQIALNVLRSITLPVILVYPLGTVLLGNLLNNQISRKKIEQGLEVSEYKLAEAQRIAHVGHWEFDLVNDRTVWSDETYRIFGLDPQKYEINMANFLEYVFPEDRQSVTDSFSNAIEKNRPYDQEYRIIRPDGTIRHVYSQGEVLHIGKQKALHIFGTTLDITERKNAELENILITQRFHLAAESALIGVWDFDIQSNVLLWDGRMFDLYKRKEGDVDLTYQDWERYIHPDDLEPTNKRIQDLITNGKDFHTSFRILWPDGQIRFLEAHAVVQRASDGSAKRIIGVNRDITELSEAEEALRRYNQRLMFLHDIERDIIEANSSKLIAKRVLEHISQLISYQYALITVLENESDKNIVFAHNSTSNSFLQEGEHINFIDNKSIEQLKLGKMLVFSETELSGDKVSSAMKQFTGRGISSGLVAPLLTKKQLIGTVCLFSSEGNFFTTEYKDIVSEVADQLSIALHQAQMSDQLFLYASELEQRVHERTFQLEYANKELEDITYSISHDLRSPLRAIDGFSKIILEEYYGRLDSEGNRLLNVIRANTQKMDQLIGDLLSISRISRDEIHFSCIDMSQMVNSAFHELTYSEDNQTFDFSVSSLPAGYGDAVLLRQVWTSLLSNSIKFTAPKNERKIDVGGYAENGMSIYYVRDNGVGFDSKYEKKLFGFFQRLHSDEEFEGTGIGLAIVHRIIHRHSGSVWAEGKIGGGSTFYFSLPQKDVNDECTKSVDHDSKYQTAKW